MYLGILILSAVEEAINSLKAGLFSLDMGVMACFGDRSHRGLREEAGDEGFVRIAHKVRIFAADE